MAITAPKHYLVKYLADRKQPFYIIVNSPSYGTMTRREAKATAKQLNAER